jgi:hypothetical protein
MNSLAKGAAVVGGVWFASACVSLFTIAATEEIDGSDEATGACIAATLLGPLLLPLLAGNMYRESKIKDAPKPEGLEVK